VGIASNTGNQKLQQPFKPLTAHGWTSLFSLTTSHSSPGVSQLYPDGWMDGWMDGWTDGRTDGRIDGMMEWVSYLLDMYWSFQNCHLLLQLICCCI